MTFRDDATAARARAEALERENERLREIIARHEAEAAARDAGDAAGAADSAATTADETSDLETSDAEIAAPPATDTALVPVATTALDRQPPGAGEGTNSALFGAGAAVAAVALGAGAIAPALGIAIGAAASALVAAGLFVLVVPPGKLLVQKGRPRRDADGTMRRYRLVPSGWRISLPLGDAHWLTLRSLPIDVDVAFPKGELASISVHGSARIDSDEPRIHRAVEALVDCSLDAIAERACAAITDKLTKRMSRLAVAALSSDALRQRLHDDVVGALDELGLRSDEVSLELRLRSS